MVTDRNSQPYKVLITGALGSIGDATARILGGTGMEVAGFDSNSPDQNVRKKFTHFSVGDIRDMACLEPAVGRADAIVHLAARVHSIPRSELEVNETFSVNQHATEKLCENCEKRGKRLVFVSTVAVYGSKANGALDENSPVAPDSPYARSKVAAERAVLSIGGFVLRLPMSYGAKDRGNMLRMIRGIDKGYFVLPGRGTAKRTFVGRWNVARAIELAVRAGKEKSGAYLVTDDETITVGDLANMIARLLGVRRPSRVPRPVLAAAAMAGSAISMIARRSMPLEWASYVKLTRDLTFDGTKIRRELGYQPMKSLQEGLKEEIDWYRSGA